MFAGFRSTFTGKKAWKWSATFSLLAKNFDMLDLGWAWFHNRRWSYANSLQVGGKSLKSFEEWNFSGQKSLTIALSLKDKVLMESFPSINLQLVAGWEYACLSQKTHNFNLSTEPCRLSAVYAKWHWSIWYQIVSDQNIGSFISCLGAP